MEDLAFFTIDDRSEYTDELYSVIGRALTVATHYDTNCKALANTLSIRKNTNLLNNETAFNNLLEKLSKRQLGPSIDTFTSRIRKALKQGGSSPEIIEAFEATIFQFLKKGRESRNFIAHDLAAGISREINNDSFREGFLKITREHIERIAKADYYISVFVENHINKTEINPSIESYIKRMCDWVCHVEL